MHTDDVSQAVVLGRRASNGENQGSGPSALSDLRGFLAAHKWFWVAPLVVIALLLVALQVVSRESLPPHVYALF